MTFYLASMTTELQDKAQNIADQFGVNWPMFIAQAVNFTLVAFVIYRFGFKGILSTIKEREKQISDSLKHAEKIKLQLEETEKKQKETLQEASIEAKKTVAGAQEQAKSYAEAQKEDARKQAEEIVAKGRFAPGGERGSAGDRRRRFEFHPSPFEKKFPKKHASTGSDAEDGAIREDGDTSGIEDDADQKR